MRSLSHFFLPFLLISLVLAGCLSPSARNQNILAPAEEDRLVIYTSHREAVYGPIIREFEARTGIWVQVKTGGTMELLNRITAGDCDCDLLFGGGVETLESHKELFIPYQSPRSQEIATIYRSSTHHWTPVSSLPIVLAYNSKLVRLNPPSGWGDLLDSNWKGRIAYADPSVSASAFTALSTLVQVYSDADTESILRAYAENLDGELLSSSSSVIEQIAQGNCYIGVTLEDEAMRSIQEGYDLDIVYPEEGTSAVCDGAAIVSRCSHLSNAQAFIDFLLEEDVQRYLSKHCSRRSVLSALTDAASDTVFLTYDIAWASERQEELLTLWENLQKEVAP